MTIDELKEQAKAIVFNTVSSFEMKGNVFIKVNITDYNKDGLREELKRDLINFKSNYTSYYELTEEYIKDYPPCSLMFHVLGITNKLKDVHQLKDSKFLDYIVSLYRLSGVTEINEGE